MADNYRTLGRNRVPRSRNFTKMSFATILFFLFLVSQLTSARLSTRIVGGSSVGSPIKYPFFADWWKGCGGSLVASDIVLTAAHCEDPSLSEPLSFGSLEYHDPNASSVVYPISYKVHPGYDVSNGRSNDFMLLQLETSVSLPIIQLNNNSHVPSDGQLLTVIGFGRTSEDGQPAQTLQEVTVKYIENCDQEPYIYADHFEIYPGPEGAHLCAGYEDGGKDSCYGDSGGPLFFRNDEDFLQVGKESILVSLFLAVISSFPLSLTFA